MKQSQVGMILMCGLLVAFAVLAVFSGVMAFFQLAELRGVWVA